jgi:hypothetical protein
MMNPIYEFGRMRELLDEFEDSREKSLAKTKLDECEMWLQRCAPTEEALARDQQSRPFLPGTRQEFEYQETEHYMPKREKPFEVVHKVDDP